MCLEVLRVNFVFALDFYFLHSFKKYPDICGTHLYSSNKHVTILTVVLPNVQWFVYSAAGLTTVTMIF
jgi:hypothetical protein